MKIGMKAAFGTLAGTALALTPMQSFAEEAANTNDAQVTLASTSAVTILQDADRAAYQWAQANPSGVAIPVRIGQDTLVPTERVTNILRSDFQSEGVSNVRFFYEAGGRGDTTVAYVTRNQVWGPYALGRARDFVDDAADQHKFEMANNLN